jgi:hypothetical protein
MNKIEIEAHTLNILFVWKQIVAHGGKVAKLYTTGAA